VRVLIACIVWACPAWAQCPVATDLATGIVVRAQQHMMTFTGIDSDLVLVEFRNRFDEQSYDATLWHGILSLQVNSSFSAGSEVFSTVDSYDANILSTLWPLRTDVSVIGGVVRRIAGTDSIQPLDLHIETSAQPAMVIYDAIRLRRTYSTGSNDFVHDDVYLPELGITMNVAYRDSETSVETPPLSIESLAAQDE
jgi:hypothetical protein